MSATTYVPGPCKPVKITASMAAVNSARIRWLRDYVNKNGEDDLLRKMEMPESFLRNLLAGRRMFTDAFTATLEARLGLEIGTIGTVDS